MTANEKLEELKQAIFSASQAFINGKPDQEMAHLLNKCEILVGIAQFRHFEKINGFTVLITRVENQIDYHTCNPSALKHLPNKGGLLVTMKVTKLCESVKPFPDPRSPKLSDASLCKRWATY
jgi:hypothetical protein